MSQWPKVKLKHLLDPVSRPESVSPERTYRVLGAHWYAHGLYTKDMLTGGEIQAPKVYRVEKGDFVYNRLFAWKGSFAVATDENDGCYVSNEFPCFLVKGDKLDARFLKYYFSRESSWSEALGLSSGGTPTSRNRLKEEAFLQLHISLPPLPQQRRLVERIDTLAAKIGEAAELRKRVVEQVNQMLICMAHRNDLTDKQKAQAGWCLSVLGDVITPRTDPVKVDTSANYPNLGIYSFARGIFEKPPINGMTTSASTLFRVRAKQFIYSRLFAFEGAYGIVPAELDGHYVSNEYPTFDCKSEKLLPEFIEAYFKAPHLWKEIATGSKGLGDRRQRVHPDQVLAHRLWVPPLEWQHRIADTRQKLIASNSGKQDIEMAINAMLPAILDRAFRGELQ